jgi:serine/threonine-protein kinase
MTHEIVIPDLHFGARDELSRWGGVDLSDFKEELMLGTGFSYLGGEEGQFWLGSGVWSGRYVVKHDSLERLERFVSQEISDLHGVFAVVLEGRDVQLDKTVMLKILKSVYLKPEHTQKRSDFFKEGRLLSMLDHPNIVKAEGFSFIPHSDKLLPVIIMEYAGEKIDESSYREGDYIFKDEIARLLTQIASALDYCHEKGLIHMDVKASNILLNKGVYKLIDFGSVQEGRELGDKLLGARCYMAPEGWRAAALGFWTELTGKVDQHCLALLAYDLLGGNILSAFKEYGDRKIIWKEKHLFEWQWLNEAGMPSKEVYEVLQRGCAFKPEDRYETCAGFARALVEVLKV